ncbi:PVC-type heme-binding CxxCH protein [Schlesneria paludicola]|uniref:PVC-type heme-binding CxxCH protein n=1 Tax=Schlesneria paludicola TaxID=360056 RepID=UPI00029B2976|nr:PVC-type heme-binding CxxCH protein [Schlesneria paludicola]
MNLYVSLRSISHWRIRLAIVGVFVFVLGSSVRGIAADAPAAEGEDFFFIPPGATQAGHSRTADGPTAGRLKITVRDAATGKPTPCRINVIGADGQFYQPEEHHLSLYSLTGEWPKKNAKGNRAGKAPYRYLGHFFYSTGEISLSVPAGEVQIHVCKGFEYRPQQIQTLIAAGASLETDIQLVRATPMSDWGYFGGDPHLHLPRTSDRDDETAFDLLDAEDISFGTPLGYNEPAGPYSGFMDKMDYPQFRGLGLASIKSRGSVHILSGQEYRSAQYGHLNLFLRDRLVLEGQSLNADEWPIYGLVGSETRSQGGYSIHAHGGYGLEIYADAALGTVDAVELLQFGIYRGIGLTDWYHMLNAGYAFPCVGASDYPACRFLGDCRTYVWSDSSLTETPNNSKSLPKIKSTLEFPTWLKAAASGQSFVTTGPMLLLDVDGKRPGETMTLTSNGRITVQVRVRCDVTAVTTLDVISNGEVAKTIKIPADQQQGVWFTAQVPLALNEPTWIAARSWSTTPGGQPDAESHTNPVYIHLGGKKPYRQASLDAWIQRIDGQLDKHRARDFAQKSKVLDYFQRARDLLLQIRVQHGLRSDQDPRKLAAELEQADAPTLAADVSRPDATDEELREFLKPVPSTPPTEAVKSFEGIAGFQMQLVAAEPLVASPIAAAFDENANLYVCEMRDYPYKPGEGLEPIGRVRLLRDTNRDGIYDEAHIFADKLLWAAGVVPWNGGVFVAACPDIWYFKDTDGDFRADIQRKVFTGFGTGNQQAMVNNLVLGMDHWIYGATAGNGGLIRPGNDPNAVPISITGRDFRFNPVTEQFEAITGTVQFGNTFDDWGNRFVCSESSPLQQIILPDHYLARNAYLPSPRGVQSIAAHPTPIYRISPIERWRQIRSSRRIANNKRNANSAGASHHVIDAAAGVTVYRGGAYPPEFYGQAFVGDGQNNLIHRRGMIPDGVPFKSERIDLQTDFIRSPDIWFRPVNLINAPDGTLYCCDMNREVLESIHIPLDVVKHLDLKSGRDNGRIYRIAPPGYTFPAPPQLSNETSEQLVALLESPHVWWRETALRLLHERQDRSVVGPLTMMAQNSERPQARLLSLWSLEGLNSLTPDSIAKALLDPHPGVRENAVRLAETQFKSAPDLVSKVASLADDDTARIRFQVAFSLGESDSPVAVAALSRIARRDGADQWIRTAVLSSVAQSADKLFMELMNPPFESNSATIAMLGQLAQVVGVRNRTSELATTLNAIASGPLAHDVSASDQILQQLGNGIKRAGGTLATSDSQSAGSALLQLCLKRSEVTASNAQESVDRRVSAINLLSCARSDAHRRLFEELLAVEQPEAVQLAAIRALADDSDHRVGGVVLAYWRTFTPECRRIALGALLSREDGTLALLEAASRDEVSVADIEMNRRELLLKHKNPSIRQLAKNLFGSIGQRARQSVVDEYKAALTLAGQPGNGKAIFEKTCIACHQLGEKGYAIGPNLASSPAREPAALLTHILDPNQFVLPNYLQYVVLDKNGRTYTGLLASQTATSITLKKERDETITILRGDIEELASSNKSLMPEGLEKDMTHQAMADLIAYLNETATQSPGDPNATRDFGTLPGLIETQRD